MQGTTFQKKLLEMLILILIRHNKDHTSCLPPSH